MKIKLGVDGTAGLAISMEPHNDVTGVFVTSVHEPLHKCCHLELGIGYHQVVEHVKSQFA